MLLFGPGGSTRHLHQNYFCNLIFTITQFNVIMYNIMIHPVYREVEDLEIATVASEAFDGSYSFRTSPDLHEKYGTEDFPPAPGEMIATTAAIAFNGGIETVYIPIKTEDEATRLAVANAYEKTVGKFQSVSGHFGQLLAVTGVTEDRVSDGLQQFLAGEIVHSGRRLLAAHHVARLVETGDIVDCLVVALDPCIDLTLQYRGIIMRRVLPLVDQHRHSGAIPPALLRQYDEAMRPIKANELAARIIGDAASASFLLEPDEIRDTILEN